ncbi:Ig-like domain-containing protein [Inconstantimicrobium mannanitabidum]|uniref:Uncharacterized protein n=1 Tax=Inconstantimicrobium mannanitabidum TaxID=1604901 RepID=A0ACB5RIC3_9CLOT|nr:Ig-like domain-containing protein [Clostridium sp. TW13]GKX68853.1 hypothetical protein rsdtw13_41110 [Clostridium sp. TW13]
MLLIITCFGGTQNVRAASTTTIGQRLLQPEDGWRRYDDTNTNIKYTGSIMQHVSPADGYYNNTRSYVGGDNCEVSFKFYGTKFRIIAHKNSEEARGANVKVSIDNSIVEEYSRVSSYTTQVLLYEKANLSLGEHTVKLSSGALNGTPYCTVDVDAIDIDKDGQLVPDNASIVLDNSSIELLPGDSQKLKATTTPEGLPVEWSVDNGAIATVDQEGNVTAVNDGTATVTAKIKGTDIKTTCVVNVKKKETDTGHAILSISLDNGNTKEYDVTMDKVNDFIKWYNARDKDKSTNSPTYTFDKNINPYKSVKESIVHDKIESYEVRQY